MQAWKIGFSETGDIALIELDIPDDAKQLIYGNNPLNRSGKCDFADVVSITIIDSNYRAHKVDKAYSAYDFDFVYEPGIRVYADRFDENIFDECTPGIHYFYYKGAAAAYAWTGWFRHKQHMFLANLSFEEYRTHAGLRYQTLITDELTKGE